MIERTLFLDSTPVKLTIVPSYADKALQSFKKTGFVLSGDAVFVDETDDPYVVLITAVKPGIATITASADKANEEKTLTEGVRFIVPPKPAERLTISVE